MVTGTPNRVYPIRRHDVPSHAGNVEIRKTPCLGDRFQSTAAAGRNPRQAVVLQRVTTGKQAVATLSVGRRPFPRARIAFPGIDCSIYASPCVPAHFV